MIDWRRRLLVRVIKIGLALILMAIGEVTGIFHDLAPSGLLSEPWLQFVAMYIAAEILADAIAGRIAKPFFRHYHLAWQLASHDSYREAVEEFRQQIAYLDQNPWIDQFRTLLFLDFYAEDFTERMWSNLADIFKRLGDTQQMVESYEKCLEHNPASFTAPYALSVIAARTGDPPRPFKIRPQPLDYGSGCAFVIIWLGVFALGTIFVNLIFFAGDEGLISTTVWNVVWTGLLLLVFFNVPIIILGWLINQVVQAGYHSACRMVAAGELEQAEQALEQDARYWRNNPGIQKMQRWFLDTTPRSYLERTLRVLAPVELKLGKPEAFASAYRECLAINPESEVRYWLNLFEGTGGGVV